MLLQDLVKLQILLLNIDWIKLVIKYLPRCSSHLLYYVYKLGYYSINFSKQKKMKTCTTEESERMSKNVFKIFLSLKPVLHHQSGWSFDRNKHQVSVLILRGCHPDQFNTGVRLCKKKISSSLFKIEVFSSSSEPIDVTERSRSGGLKV